MTRLDGLMRSLGPAGIVGIGVLLACLAFYFSALRPAQRELSAEQLASQRARPASPVMPAVERGQAGNLHRFYRLFPPLARLPDELERLYGLARAAQLDLLRGDYRLDPGDGPLRAYRVSLPLRGTYPRIRQFLRATLASMPIASIDALRFERERAGEPQLRAQLQLTLYFRSGAQGDAEGTKP